MLPTEGGGSTVGVQGRPRATRFHTGTLALPIPTNSYPTPYRARTQAASAAGLDLVLLVYALHECDHDRPGLDASGRPPHWAALLLELWDAAAPSTLFLIKDQDWVEERARALLARERPGGVASCVVPRAEGVRKAAQESDGLFLLKTQM